MVAWVSRFRKPPFTVDGEFPLRHHFLVNNTLGPQIVTKTGPRKHVGARTTGEICFFGYIHIHIHVQIYMYIYIYSHVNK